MDHNIERLRTRIERVKRDIDDVFLAMVKVSQIYVEEGNLTLAEQLLTASGIVQGVADELFFAQMSLPEDL